MPRSMATRLERIEHSRKPARPAWQVALEHSEDLWRGVEAQYQAIIAEAYPDGVPVVDEATWTPEERAEAEAAIRAMREDCERAAQSLRRA